MNLINLRGVMSECRDDSGMSASFWKMGKMGIKLFHDKETRDYVYSMQKLLSFHGISPKCWGRFNTIREDTWNGVYMHYGFITDVIKVNEDYGEIYDHPDGIHLMQQAYDLGFAIADMGYSNFGTNEHGELQVLDTGHVTYKSGEDKRTHTPPYFEGESDIHNDWASMMMWNIENP